MISIAEVAKQAGVSPATVSRVLNSSATVKEETKERVLRVIRENNYTPNIAARNLSLQSSLNNIGVVIPDVDNPFFCSVLKGVTQTADKYRYNTLLFNTDETPEREHRFLQTVREQNLKGIIMIPISERDSVTQEYLTDLEASGVPVVLVDRRIGDTDFDGVFTEDEQDSFRAVEALIHAGHTRIATIAGPQRSTPGHVRLQGYKRALETNQLEVRDAYIEIGDFKFQSAYEAAKRLMELPNPPTAIFTANNFSTLAALQCMTELGYTVGKDISLIGFDELQSWMRYSPLLNGVDLSLVERPVEQMAAEAVELLQDRIMREKQEYTAKKRLVLSNRLVLRGSERLSKTVHTPVRDANTKKTKSGGEIV